jgi:hypothetical protein
MKNTNLRSSKKTLRDIMEGTSLWCVPRMNGACCILGSATPSLESLYNVRAGKYGVVKLNASS